MHGPGTVRSGKWKFYPWQEGKGGSRRSSLPADREPSSLPAQLYDTDTDIAETTNLADKHPEVVARLHKAYDTHVAEIEGNRRPTAELLRREGAPSSERPGGPKKSAGKKGKK